MSSSVESYESALERAKVHALEWLGSLDERPMAPRVRADELLTPFGGPLAQEPMAADAVIDELAALAEPGLMAMPSGRFFGWVTGGTLPAALAADWLISAWDQNAATRFATPASVAAEEAAGAWLLDLFGLPSGCDVGFTTGATMSNFVGLAAGRQRVLDAAGWDLARDGLAGAPCIRVYVGAERHDVIDLALRYLGLGAPIVVDVDGQGRLRPEALENAMDEAGAFDGPAIVCLQAGNLHSGASDPMRAAIEIAHARGAWVHVDGAFGLWAAASPLTRDQLDGVDTADSWASDAHKTLNVPYDCGIAIVAHPDAVRAALGVHPAYLITDSAGPGDPFERVPEFSRRARGVTVWAALRSLGRAGTVELVDRLCATARAFADGIAEIPGAQIVNEVSFTQVCVSFGDDERTARVTARLLADGVTWMSGSRWRGRIVLRISASNWSTDAEDIERSLEALRFAAESA